LQGFYNTQSQEDINSRIAEGREYLREQRTDFGFVYLMVKDDGAHKIGYTTQKIHQRRYQIQSQVKQKVKLIACKWVENPTALECNLHMKYKHCRLGGEWFNLSSSEINEVITVLDGGVSHE